MGIVPLATSLIADLPGHTSSITNLVKISEYSFLSIDDASQIIIWKVFK